MENIFGGIRMVGSRWRCALSRAWLKENGSSGKPMDWWKKLKYGVRVRLLKLDMAIISPKWWRKRKRSVSGWMACCMRRKKPLNCMKKLLCLCGTTSGRPKTSGCPWRSCILVAWCLPCAGRRQSWIGALSVAWRRATDGPGRLAKPVGQPA